MAMSSRPTWQCFEDPRKAIGIRGGAMAVQVRVVRSCRGNGTVINGTVINGMAMHGNAWEFIKTYSRDSQS